MLITIKPINVIDHTDLPEVTVDWVPVAGDPLEIGSDTFVVCETSNQVEDGSHYVGVIPLIYKNDIKAVNPENYMESLYFALRKMQDRPSGDRSLNSF